MRKFLISATLLASSLAIAAPAAAQVRVTVGTQYGNAYGYGNQYGQVTPLQSDYGGVRSLQVRLNNLERQINRLDRRNILSEREADRLRWQANAIERQIRQAGRNGLNGYERRNLEIRIVAARAEHPLSGE